MLEAFVLLGWIALFALGYGTRSYIGSVLPLAVLVWAVIAYQQNMPTNDEIRVLYTAYVVASAIGLLIYLGGVALGRRPRSRPSERAEFR